MSKQFSTAYWTSHPHSGGRLWNGGGPALKRHFYGSLKYNFWRPRSRPRVWDRTWWFPMWWVEILTALSSLMCQGQVYKGHLSGPVYVALQIYRPHVLPSLQRGPLWLSVRTPAKHNQATDWWTPIQTRYFIGGHRYTQGISLVDTDIHGTFHWWICLN